MKNFETMTTKKLNALMATASDEDKAAIQAVLDSRNQVVNDSEDSELTAEEQAAIEYAEANNGENPMHKSKKERMTDEARAALAAELREKYLHHKCQVVLHNTVIWTDGYIAGVIEEKKASTVLFRIKLTETGRTMNKVYDSPMLKISEDETVTPTRKVVIRSGKAIDKSEPWTEEAIAEELAKYQGLVGMPCEVTKEDAKISGRISGLVPEKRQRTILLRIAYETADGTKYMHKVAHEGEIPGLTILEADEEFAKLNAAYAERNSPEAKAARRTKGAPKERVFALTAKLEAANKALEAQKAKIEKLTAELAQAQAELDAALEAEQTNEDLA